MTDQTHEQTHEQAHEAAHGQATVEPTRWQVRPGGIEGTRFDDPESFYLDVRLAYWRGERVFIVSHRNDSAGFTKHGRTVYLRHDVNAKHARFASFEEAETVARAIADGHLSADTYMTWRQAETRRFPPVITVEN